MPSTRALSELSTMTCASWVALPGMAHSVIELHNPLCPDKAVIHEGEGNPNKGVYGNIWLIDFASQQKVRQHYKELYSNKINNEKKTISFLVLFWPLADWMKGTTLGRATYLTQAVHSNVNLTEKHPHRHLQNV